MRRTKTRRGDGADRVSLKNTNLGYTLVIASSRTFHSEKSLRRGGPFFDFYWSTKGRTAKRSACGVCPLCCKNFSPPIDSLAHKSRCGEGKTSAKSQVFPNNTRVGKRGGWLLRSESLASNSSPPPPRVLIYGTLWTIAEDGGGESECQGPGHGAFQKFKKTLLGAIWQVVRTGHTYFK